MKQTSQSPLQPTIDWLKENPELVSGGLDIFLLAATVGLIITRQSLDKIKSHLKQTVDQLKKPPKSHDYTLDSTVALKQTVYYHINKLLNSTSAKWCCLGVLTNGQISNWGYHYSKLNWDFIVHEPTTEPPLGQLQKLDCIKLSVELFNLHCTSEAPSVQLDIMGYHSEFYGIKFGNILVAIVALGFQDKPQQPYQSICSTINQLENILGSLINNPN